MIRKFDEKLKQWKDNNIDTPLMVIGARQIGKTYTINEFCINNFKEYIYINLELEEEIKKIFDTTINPDEVIKRIEIIKGFKINIPDTVIFFDEIQVSERAITSLKYFCESENKYKIVCAGSLLGVKLNRFRSSFPVGKVRIEHMYPMDFEEFMIAIGQKLLIDEITRCYEDKQEMLETFHKRATDCYLDYLCIGGMPKAVLEYIKNDNKVVGIDKTIHENIIESYISDMKKYTYSSAETIKIQKVYETMPLQLGKDNTKFKYSVIESGAKKNSYKLPIDWLISSNLLLKCERVTKPEVPMRVYVATDMFKLYLSDVGLLACLSRIKHSDILLNGDYMFKGAITENYVATILNTYDIDLKYWRASNEAEIDFLIDLEDGIIPIEVKGSYNTRSKSLNEFMKKYNSKYGIRLSLKNFGFTEKIVSIPLYATYLFEENIK